MNSLHSLRSALTPVLAGLYNDEERRLHRIGDATLRALTLALFGFASVISVVGQTTYGSLTGTVTDQSGAVIPNASITVTNEATGIQRSTTTSTAGVYVVPNLDVGTYRVHIEKTGFQAYERTGLHLAASQTVNVDAPLALAATGTRVEVTGAAPTLNTQTATQSSVLPAREILELPLVARQRGDQGLYAYGGYNVGASVPAPWWFQANGSRMVDTQPSVDGITQLSTADSVGGSTIQTGIEATSEVNVQLNNAPAEFSRPVQMQMVSKAGTNQFHGSLFEDYNGNSLNARNFFTATVPFRVYNNFGSSFGGPIKKDKSFFFGSYEGSRESTAVIDTLNVPLPAWRTGDFSGISNVITNPFTGQPFPNNQIPSSMISPVSQKIQSLYFLLPNYGPPGLRAGNYRNLFHPGNNGVTIFNRFDTRLDHNFGSHDSLFGRFSYNRMPIHAYVANAIPPFGFRTSLRVADSGVVSWTHIVTHSAVNEFRGGYTRDNNQIRSPITGSDILQQVGIQGISTTGIPTYPSFSVTGLSTPGGVPYFGGITTTFEFTDSLSWVHGSHAAKFGLDITRDRDSSFFYGGNVYGTYSFPGTFSGFPYADFLLGIPRATSINIPTPKPHQFGAWWAAYAQDQFKIARNLTISYGVRWEAQQPYHDNRGLLASFDPNTGALVIADQGLSHVNPAFPPNIPIETASKAGFPAATLLESHHAYFYPRLGVAYRPFSSSKTVVRAGYGIYPLTTYGALALYLTGGPFSGSQSFTNKIVDGVPLFSFPRPFLSGGQVPVQNVQGINPSLRIGYMQQWSLTVEREAAGFVFGVSYVGTHTVNIPYQRNLDQPPPGMVPFSAAELKYPAYISVGWMENGGTDKYNALSLYARRTYGKNLFVNAGFTWARDLTDTQDAQLPYGPQIQNSYNRAAEYGPNALYRPTRLFANVVYALPVGKGQMFLGNASRFLDLLLGGWKMAWNVVAEAGKYFTPSFDGFDPSNTNSFGGRPDVVAGVSPYASSKTINRWLNPAAFKIPGCPDSTPLCSNPANIGRFGNAGVSSLEGPPLTDFDLSLMKDFRVSERFTLQFRATATNVFNHPNFGQPAADISAGPGNYGVITGTAFDLQGQQSRFIDFMLRLRF
jgi:hypothetical protein